MLKALWMSFTYFILGSLKVRRILKRRRVDHYCSSDVAGSLDCSMCLVRRSLLGHILPGACTRSERHVIHRQHTYHSPRCPKIFKHVVEFQRRYVGPMSHVLW
jgi:hypothetical protein